jgi:predicted secreted Zn-dependent protease
MSWRPIPSERGPRKGLEIKRRGWFAIPGVSIGAAMRFMLLVMTAALFANPAAARDWEPREVVKPYAISGATPIELYESIGANGPVIGEGRRTIAVTRWDLKWRRDYQPEGSACVLKSALPFLTIATSLPKPKAKLPDNVARLWKIFIDGIAAHEKVHGQDIIAMVDSIIAETVGLRIENDPDCKLIRTEVLKRVEAANEAYKSKARTFDQTEMSDGGNVHQLILGLVNGR